MSDAVKHAEEALARWDGYADRPHSDARHEALYACVRSLRALLAERAQAREREWLNSQDAAIARAALARLAKGGE